MSVQYMRNVQMCSSILLMPFFTLEESMKSSRQNNKITYENIQKQDSVNFKHTIH